MADISQYLQAIMSAVYGEDVRSSIHDAIAIINDVSEVVLSTGTAITGPTSSSAGFYQDSLYLNTSTFELWKCTGQDSWASQGVVKGATGNGIASIEKTSTSGLVDTYTITYTDGNITTFDITNGEDGEDGNRWFRGTAISGKATNPTVYPTGITYANPNDFYLNPTEGAVYHCVSGGDATTATWSYDFTMAGGGGSVANLNDLEDVTVASPSSGEALVFNGSSQKWENGRAYTLPTATTSDLGGVKIDGTSITINSSGVISTDGYAVGDTVDSTIDDADYMPFYDTSASAKKKITWQNIKTAIGSVFAKLTDLDTWTATATVSSGTVSFSGINDTNNNGYKPFCLITSSSTNKNPSFQISSISGEGTASMSVSFTTDADNGASVKLRIVK